jgi:serine/threonine protein kinase
MEAMGARPYYLQQERPGHILQTTALVVDTAPGIVMGTPQYMSPEQASGEELDARIDLFSFGALLYEMATGSAPFKGDSIAVILEAILNREPVPPTQLNPNTPAELEHIIGKALEKDRALRCQSAGEMLADLKRLRRDVSSGRPAANANQFAEVAAFRFHDQPVGGRFLNH